MTRFEMITTWFLNCLGIVLVGAGLLVVPANAFADSGGAQCATDCGLLWTVGTSDYYTCIGGCCGYGCGGDPLCRVSCCADACGIAPNCQTPCSSAEDGGCSLSTVCDTPGSYCVVITTAGGCPKTNVNCANDSAKNRCNLCVCGVFKNTTPTNCTCLNKDSQ
jgi:hypothetical protein